MTRKLSMVGNHIKNKDSKYKGKHKAQELAKCKIRKFNGIEIESLSVERGMLKVIIKGQGDRNPFYFQNPPILVQDGTFSTDKDGNEVANFKEDLEEALQQIINQVI
jgi:hypothetical protein